MTHLRSAEAGFTLIEMLIATALSLLVLGTLATVTAQWLPNWNRGFTRVQRTEQLALAMDRIVNDLAAAEFVPPNADTKLPLFDGSELMVTFVRTAVGPNSRIGLELVRFMEIADNGPVLVRATAPFVPLDADTAAVLRFSDQVILIRAPYRVVFSYAGPDRVWQTTWRNANELPSAVRIAVRDTGTGQTLAVSTAVKIHVDAPAECTIPNAPNCPVAISQSANDPDDIATRAKRGPDAH